MLVCRFVVSMHVGRIALATDIVMKHCACFRHAGTRRQSLTLCMQWGREPPAYMHVPMPIHLVARVLLSMSLIDSHHTTKPTPDALSFWSMGQPRPRAAAHHRSTRSVHTAQCISPLTHHPRRPTAPGAPHRARHPHPRRTTTQAGCATPTGMHRTPSQQSIFPLPAGLVGRADQ